MTCFRSRRGSERERMTCSQPAEAPFAREGDLILLVWGRDPRDGWAAPEWPGMIDHGLHRLHGLTQTGYREARSTIRVFRVIRGSVPPIWLASLSVPPAGRHHPAFRKFPLARSVASGSLRLSGTGGDPLRNQGPNKAWDATRQSGPVPTGSRSPIRTDPK
jgi:hypothetical protein